MSNLVNFNLPGYLDAELHNLIFDGSHLIVFDAAGIKPVKIETAHISVHKSVITFNAPIAAGLKH